MENELKKRAKKHSKKQSGLSPFSYLNTNAGDEMVNTEIFNSSTSMGSGMGEEYKICETSTSRIYQHISDENKKFAIVSPYRSEYSEKENKQRMSELKQKVHQMGFGFIQMLSRWVEDGEAFDEQSLLIPNISREVAIKLGKEYEQSSIIYKEGTKCEEICTTPFEKYKENEVVRTFNTSGNKILNIHDAEEIFAHRKGGPVSKAIKGGKPFTLSELYEVEPPRPSYFGASYHYSKILEKKEFSEDNLENLDKFFKSDYVLDNNDVLSVKEALDELNSFEEDYSLNETSLSRILQHTQDKDTFAVIGSQDKDTKKDRYTELLDEIAKLQKKYDDRKIGFNHLKGTYTYEDGTVGTESSLIIYNIPKEEALRIAKKLNQESIIWKDNNFFGFLTAEGREDGDLGRGLSFDKDAVQAYGSRLSSKHNKGKPFIFEAFLVTTTNRGSNTSRQNKSHINEHSLFKVRVNSDTLDETSSKSKAKRLFIDPSKMKYVKTFAIFTAYNPDAKQISQKDNTRIQKHLKGDLSYDTVNYIGNKNRKYFDINYTYNPITREYTYFNTKDMEKALKSGHWHYYKAKGKYFNVEESLLVYNITLDESKELCAKYQQQSFIFGTNNDGVLKFEFYANRSKNGYSYIKVDEKDTFNIVDNNADNLYTQIARDFKINIPFEVFEVAVEDMIESINKKNNRLKWNDDSIIKCIEESVDCSLSGKQRYFARSTLWYNK